MTTQPTNNGYTRCSECAEVYSASMKSCPKCGKQNPAYSVNEENLSFLDHYEFDYVIDAIDDISAKVLLIKYLQKRNIPFISSLGMGNRIDCSNIEITKINKTHDDPLARKLRYLLKKEEVDLSQVDVIFSSSKVEQTDVNFVSSIMPSPSCAGLSAVAYIIKKL